MRTRARSGCLVGFVPKGRCLYPHLRDLWNAQVPCVRTLRIPLNMRSSNVKIIEPFFGAWGSPGKPTRMDTIILSRDVENHKHLSFLCRLTGSGETQYGLCAPPGHPGNLQTSTWTTTLTRFTIRLVCRIRWPVFLPYDSSALLLDPVGFRAEPHRNDPRMSSGSYRKAHTAMENAGQ